MIYKFEKFLIVSNAVPKILHAIDKSVNITAITRSKTRNHLLVWGIGGWE